MKLKKYQKAVSFFLAFCTCFSSVPTQALAEIVEGDDQQQAIVQTVDADALEDADVLEDVDVKKDAATQDNAGEQIIATEEPQTQIVSQTISFEAMNTVATTDVARIGDNGYASFANALEAATTGDTIYLLANYTEDDEAELTNATVTLDLNGFVLTFTNGDGLTLGKKATLTIVDSSQAGTGKISNADSGGSAVYLDHKQAVLNVQSGTLSVTGERASAIYVDNGAKVEISGGAIEGSGYGLYNKTANVTIAGGTITSDGTAIYNREDGYVTIANATISGATSIHNADGGDVQVASGTIIGTMKNATSDSGSLTVTGGAYSVRPDTNNYAWDPVAKGYGIYDGSDANAPYCVGQAYAIEFDANAEGATGTIANIDTFTGKATTLPSEGFTLEGYTLSGWTDGTTQYDLGGTYTATGPAPATVTLKAVWTPNTYTVAFDANGGTGTMANQSFVYDTAQNLTANAFTNGNGTFIGWSTDANATAPTYTDAQSINNLATEANATVTLYAVWALAQVQVGDADPTYYTSVEAAIAAANSMSGNPVVKLLGNQTLTDYPEVSGTMILDLNGKTINGANYYLRVTGNLTIKDSGTTGTITGSKYGVLVNNGTVTIEGGTISGSTSALYNKNSTSSSKIYVTGGKIKGKLTKSSGKIELTGGIYSSQPSEDYCAQGYAVVDNTDVATHEAYPYTVATMCYIETNGVKTYYSGLAAAIKAAQAGDTIVLVADVTLAETQNIEKNLTIDLNDHTITGNTIDEDEGRAHLSVWAGDVTLKNGTINARVNAYDEANLTLVSDLTVNGIVVVWGDGTYGQEGCKTPTLNVYGTITNNDYFAISTNGTDKSGANINIYNGASVTSVGEIAIYQPSGNVTVSGGTITGATAIYTKAGNLTITGGTITGNGAKADYQYDGSGANATGDAIVVDSCGYPNGAPVVAISGSPIVTSTNASGIGAYTGNGVEDIAEIKANSTSITLPEGQSWVATDVAGTYEVGVAIAKIGNVNYASLAAAIEAAQAGDTIVLVADVTLAETQDISKSLTIDLNGHNITATDARALWIKSGDVTIAGTGTISSIHTEGNDWPSSNSVIRVGSSGADKAKLTIGSGVTVSAPYSYGVTVFGTNTAGVELVVNGTVQATGIQAAISGNGNAGNKGAVTINAGAVVSAANDAAIYHPQGDALTIAGGTITGPTGVYVKSGTVAISGGTITGNGAKTAYNPSGNGLNSTGDALVIDACDYPGGAPTASITGGTFASTNGKQVGYYLKDNSTPATVTSTITTLTLPESYAWQAQDDGSYKVVEAVAKIGDKGYATLAEAIQAASAGDTVTLLADTKVESITVAKAVTLDLNGKTVSSDKAMLFEVTSAGDLTITGNGYINGPTNGQDFDSKTLITVDGGKLTVLNGTLTATGSGSDGMYGVYVLNGGTAVFGAQGETGGPTITSHFAAIGTNNTTAPATITVYGGTYTAQANPVSGSSVAWWYYFCAPVYAASSGTYDLQGGTFNGYYGISSRYANVEQTITLGNVTITASSGTEVFVDGQTGSASQTNRTITATSNELDLPAGYAWQAQDDGTYKVVEAVAKIGDKGYLTLEAAIAAANDGDTVTLLKDASGNGIQIPQGKFNTNGLTVDFGGHTYTVSGTPVGSAGTETIGFQLLKDNKITFKNGTIYGDSYTNQDLVRLVQNYSDLTLDGMTLSMKGCYYNQLTMSSCYGTTIVKDSTISAPDYSWISEAYSDPATVGAAAFSVGTFSSYEAASVDVQGNSQIKGDVKVDPSNAGTTTLTLSGGTMDGKIVLGDEAEDGAVTTVTKADSFVEDAPEGYYWKSNDNGTASLATLVASIGDQGYDSLAAAIAAVPNNGDTQTTITLQKDVTEDSVAINGGKNILLDLGTHTLTSSFMYVLNGKLEVKNGTVDNIINVYGYTADGQYVTYLKIDSDAVVNGGDNAGKKAIILWNLDDSGACYDATIDVEGTLNASIFVSGNIKSGDSVINFSGTLVGAEDVGIALNGYATLNVTGGSISAGDTVDNFTGIEVRSGALNVTGGTIVGKGAYAFNPNGNGTTSTGCGIAVAQHTTQNNINVNITGGNVSGTVALALANPQQNTQGDLSVSVSGGTFTSTDTGTNPVAVVLDEGETRVSAFVSGGSFSDTSVYDKGYCVDEYYADSTTLQSDGLYQVVKCDSHVDTNPKNGICDVCGHRIGSKVTVTSSGNGTTTGSTVATVSGGGVYLASASVTLKATNVSGYTFLGWYEKGATTATSTDLSYTFTVDGQTDYDFVAVYKAESANTTFDLVVTASKFKVNNGTTQYSRMDTKVSANSDVTVTFTGSEHFLYWINSSNKVVSTTAEYNFTITQNTSLTAVYSYGEEPNEALVVFVSANSNGQVMSSRTYSTRDDILFPSAPSSMGKTFKYWSLDGVNAATEEAIHDAIANSENGRVLVYPVYEESGSTYQVTVNYVNENGTSIKDPYITEETAVGTGTTLTAPAIDGKTFSYWSDAATEGNVLAYTTEYFVRPTKSLNIYAVYDAQVEAVPVVHMTDAYTSISGDYYALSFTATRSVPEGYAVNQVGMLYIRADKLANDTEEAAKDALKIDSTNDDVKNYKDSSTALNGTFTLTIKTLDQNRKYYVLGYVTATKDGVTQTYYADNVMSGSYTSIG